MILAIDFTRVALGFLYTSLAVIVLVIAYRKLLRYLNRGTPVKEHYCVLYPLEKSPASGEIEFYFTSDEPKRVTFEILDSHTAPLETIAEKEFPAGGNILRYDSSRLANGTYFYRLRTENQQTMKKFEVLN